MANLNCLRKQRKRLRPGRSPRRGGGTFGSVNPGDLFYIDATGTHHDLAFSLYITNAAELAHYLRYLILEVNVYAASDNSLINEGDNYLTLQNSPVKFIASGETRYKVRIDSGSYYCLPAGSGRAQPGPGFYLTVGSAE